MSQVVKREPGSALLLNSRAPDAISKIIDMEEWAQAVVNGTKYQEPDPNFLSRYLALQIITAETVDEAFRKQNIKGVQEIVPDTPGATTGPMEITDVYVAESSFDAGHSCFVIITAVDLEMGGERKMTTSATNIQATLISLIHQGQWPIRCQIKRGDSKDRGGHYLLFMVPPD
jgi:hypothetical protein